MNFKNLSSSLNIRCADHDFSVKTSGTKYSRIKNVNSVCGSKHYYSFINAKTVHLNKKLVKSLLSLIMSAAHTGTTFSSDGIYFINKYDTRCIFLSFFKQITH